MATNLEPGPATPRLWGRVLVAEMALTVAEAALCGLPLAAWLRVLPYGVHVQRMAGPVLIALWVVLLLRLLDMLRPVAELVQSKAHQQPVVGDEAEAAQRTLVRIPRESAALRFGLWVAVAGALAAYQIGRDDGREPGTWAFAALLVLHALGVAGLRALALEEVLGCLRPIILPHVEAIRLFASGYRFRIAASGAVTLGLAHAALVLALLGFVGLTADQRAVLELLLWPTLIPAGVMWALSGLRRMRAIERYFDVTLRVAGTRGPARQEPRAVTAFVAAQGLPYRLAGYAAFSIALAGVLAIAVARRLGGLEFAQAGRLLGALAVVVTASFLFEALSVRRLLGPLMRHIGSRHHLPVKDIRSRVGLRAKLLGSFFAVAAIGCGGLALFAYAPVASGAWAVAALVVVFVVVLGLSALVARELVAPIQALEARSDEMARGELARPVPPGGEADEIGRLTVAFEEMRRSLRDRLRSTESINIDLEREVRRRTDALEQRNAELREALEKLRRAQDNLVRSEKLASMGRLVAGIAHEINNPVNAIINSLGPLEETIRQFAQVEGAPQAGPLAGAADEMLAVIQRGATRTKAIVQALHNYSRGDETTQREVSLNRSVDDSLDLLKHRLRNVKVEKSVDPAAGIMGFPGQIDQVLMNLITNAVQAMGDKGGTIRVGAEMQADGVMVTISDDGPGIPAEVLPRIFDPFFTTKPVGEGSGLGLSIVHGIIERHGGHVDVESTPGRGTTFRLTFPRVGSMTAAPGKTG